MRQKTLSKEQGVCLLSDYLCKPLSPEERKSKALVAMWTKERAQAEAQAAKIMQVLRYMSGFVPREDWNWVFKRLKWPCYESHRNHGNHRKGYNAHRSCGQSPSEEIPADAPTRSL